MEPRTIFKIIAFALALVGAEIAANAADDADNAKRNMADRDEGSVTPTDQGTSEADIAITRQIRKGVVDRGDLSVNAQNVKIVTRDGVVTLRGPVADAREKTVIVMIAKQATGVKRVDDQLEAEGAR
jgi:osmotically-inducible protein OsmY